MRVDFVGIDLMGVNFVGVDFVRVDLVGLPTPLPTGGGGGF